jgi:hypothetical protein
MPWRRYPLCPSIFRRTLQLLGPSQPSPFPPSALNPRRALEVLGIRSSMGLTTLDIKKAYARQSLRCHPDINPKPDAKEQFQLLTEAVGVAVQAVLKNERTKRSGDKAGTVAAPTAEDALRSALDEHLKAKRRLSGSPVPQRDRAPRESTARDQKRVSGIDDDGDEQLEFSDAFYTPTVEEITRVCQQEAECMRLIHRFCNELPATLCGHQRMLFDCIGSADPHCVAPLAEAMDRFAKNLPVIVRRVVKLREKTKGRRQPTSKRIVKGLGAGAAVARRAAAIAQDEEGGDQGGNPSASFSPADGDRIEDMPLKPLVLIGALLFTDNRVSADPISTADEKPADDVAQLIKSSGVQCCRELCCVLRITDSVDDIAEKMAVWELQSYHRLRLELSIASTASLFFSLLELPDDHSAGIRASPALSTSAMQGRVRLTASHARACGSGVSFHVPPTLWHPLHVIERVSLTVQRLSCLLCQVPSTPEHDSERRAEKWGNPEQAGGAGPSENTSAASTRLLLEIRELCRVHRVLSHIEGHITLVWDPKSIDQELVSSPEMLAAADVESGRSDKAAPAEDDRPDGTQGGKGYVVRRHPRCCSADAVQFAVSVRLSRSLPVFLNRLLGAFREVAIKARDALANLPAIQEIQLRIRRDEFIPVDVPPQIESGGAPASPPSDGDRVDEFAGGSNRTYEFLSEYSGLGDLGLAPSPHRHLLLEERGRASLAVASKSFRHRAAIRCVSRVCNMDQAAEHLFWQLLFGEREFIASQPADSLPSGLNVFFECLPYSPSTIPATVTADDVLGQWPLKPLEEVHQQEGSISLSSLSLGWAGDSADGDLATISREELASAEKFGRWLRELVSDCRLACEARELLRRSGIGYISREPYLSPRHFLTFVQLYCKSSAARAAVEAGARRQPSAGAEGQMMTASAIGFAIQVGAECDVRDGGNWVIPWNVDPAMLIGLLAGPSTEHEEMPLRELTV